MYVSVANIRKDRMMDPSRIPSSLLPAPNFESVPTIQLLKEENFLQLFNLLDVLYRVCQLDDYKEMWASVVENKLDDSSVLEDSTDTFENQHELVKPLPADLLLYNAWDLILLLPTNQEIKNRILQGEFESPGKWKQILCLEQKFRLLYILQILDGLTLPLMTGGSQKSNSDSSGDSDSSLSDVESCPMESCSFDWVKRLFESGMIAQLLALFMCKELDPATELDEWSLNALAYIIKILTRTGLVNITYKDEKPSSSVSEATTSSATAGPSSSASAVTSKAKSSKRHVFRARYRSTEIENVVVIRQFNQVWRKHIFEFCSSLFQPI